MRRSVLQILPGVLALLCFCSKPVIKPGYDFSRIRTFSVQGIDDFFSVRGSGEMVERSLLHHLLEMGIDVVERQELPAVLKETVISQSGLNDNGKDVSIKPADAILVCSITDFKKDKAVKIPVEIKDRGRTVKTVEKKYTVSNDTSKTELVPEKITEHKTEYKGSITHTQRIVYLEAAVSLTLQAIDPKDGSIVWSARSTYNAFDLHQALSKCVAKGLRPLEKLLK